MPPLAIPPPGYLYSQYSKFRRRHQMRCDCLNTQYALPLVNLLNLPPSQPMESAPFLKFIDQMLLEMCQHIAPTLLQFPNYVNLRGQSNLANVRIRGRSLLSVNGGLKGQPIIINIWHHIDVVTIHLGGLTASFSNPAFLLLSKALYIDYTPPNDLIKLVIKHTHVNVEWISI